MVPPTRTPGTPVGRETARPPEEEWGWESAPQRAHPRASRSTRERVAVTQYKNGPGSPPGPPCVAIRQGQETLRTFCACRPFGPWATSNSTASPSARLRKPSAWIAVKWTNTSGPDSCAIKPKPFASLNHFTFPFAILRNLFTNGASPGLLIDPGHRDLGRAQTKTARLDGPRGAQTAGDGATYCLNRGQR